MNSRRLKELKNEIYKLLEKPSTINQILNNLKQTDEYEFLSWKSVETRLEELLTEKKIKLNGDSRTRIYYK